MGNNKKILFIVNPVAGKAVMKTHLLEVAEIFQKNGYEVTLRITMSPEDAGLFAGDCVGFDRLVCAGGDGTLSEVVNAVVHSGSNIPVGYIPCGTTNDFANTLGLSCHPDIAASYASTGEPVCCDVGEFNGRCFTYTAAFGLFSDVSYVTPQKIKNLIGRTAYLLNGAESMLDIKPKFLHINIDGRPLPEEKFLLGMVLNSGTVGGFKKIGGIETDLNDGLFEAVFVKMPSNPLEMQQILHAFVAHELVPEYGVYYARCSCVEAISGEAVPWTVDGDFGGTSTHAILNVIPNAVRYIAKI